MLLLRRPRRLSWQHTTTRKHNEVTSETPLSRLDLNLLVSLDALLTERSVTRAAERLHLSQPALSASLGRLRTHFDDKILARTGNTYELTPLAVRLSELTATALDSARRVFDSQAEWNPTQSTREFTVLGSDYGFATIGVAVSKLAAQAAPGVRFRFRMHNPSIVEDAIAQLRSVDAMMIPHGFLSELPFNDLFTDEWRIICSHNNPHVGEHLTMENIAELPWVFNYLSRSAFTSASRQIRELGIEPIVAAVVEGFHVLPHFVEGTNRLALMQKRLTDILIPNDEFRVLEPPFDATPISAALWWHPTHSSDPEHAWMRRLFAQAGAEMQAEAGSA
ncbi:LysR family transcriptional regulator [Pseudoclavibacter sp. RFBB5]|nr:LysR family transcriptional regulator [Pseudoclavibacter sp. RFBB5]